MQTQSTKRTRGGQPGNSNRLTHGLYSQHISVKDDTALAEMSLERNENELALARVRLSECLARQAKAPPEEWLAYEKAISHYLSIIFGNTNKNALLGRDSRLTFVTVLEMIRQVNEHQGIK